MCPSYAIQICLFKQKPAACHNRAWDFDATGCGGLFILLIALKGNNYEKDIIGRFLSLFNGFICGFGLCG